MRVDPAEWVPIGVDELEDAAEEVVRSDRCTLVTAGPGAGKTELLAQRGCYLLQTGLCPVPRRILAISYKVDAAANLAKRVSKRCGEDARRFHSVTLDAFAKGLVDRFRLGLPAELRPVANFAPRLAPPRDAELGEFLQSLTPPSDIAAGQGMVAVHRRAFFERQIIGAQLQWPNEAPASLAAWAANQYWIEAINNSAADTGSLTFPMIARLAELILRLNPSVLQAMRAAYPFVFMDEFQDTTPWHYQILRTAFNNTDAQVTAVGDTKQRIMLWAGAQPGVSDEFIEDFEADPKVLLRNYRSAPRLVQMQNDLARLLEDEPVECVPAGQHEHEGTCQVLECDDASTEAEWITREVERGIASGLSPDDFCLIYRQRVAAMSEPAVAALNSVGIRARDETAYQDLLDEVAVRVVVASIRAALIQPEPDAWVELTEIVRRVHGLSEDDVLAERIASRVIETAGHGFSRDPTEGECIGEALSAIIDELGRDTLREAVPAYSRTEWLSKVLERLTDLLLQARRESEDWYEGIERFEGHDTVRAMTIHKSKGLEYHTVIFVGLEDSSWWAFARQEEEERRAFFVAFSRAIERVVFTFARRRDTGRGVETQRRSGVSTLYQALDAAGADRVAV